MTQAAQAPPETPAAPTPEPDGLSDTIDRISEAVGSDDTDYSLADGVKPKAAPEKEQPAPEKTPEPAKADEKQWDLSKGFTDEELATPEGIKAAAEKIRHGFVKAQTAWEELDASHAALTRREKKFNEKLGKYKQEKERDTAFLQSRLSDLDLLHKGDAGTALDALGRLRGKSGAEALEELNLAVIHNGKQRQSAALTKEEVTQLLKQEREAWQAEQQERQKQQRIQELHRDAVEFQDMIDSKTYPYLAKFAERDLGGTLADILEGHALLKEQRGQHIDKAAVLREIEDELAKDFGPASGSNGARNGTSATSPTAQSSPGQTLSPSLSAQSSGRRDLDEHERRKAAEDLVPDAWVRLGSGS